ncbi:MAG: alpha/beta fold hydrolase [Candidatus Wallbacteria bacterium]|nr:alpha/beta fold hydrolase [Candidatus Wallbacteria bacterium]
MAFADTTAGKLHFEECGAGIPIVFLHSLFCDSSMWRHQVEDFSRDHRLILIDGPGHGQSAIPREPLTIEQCARGVLDVLDFLELPSAILAGISWGGMTAMRAALDAPARVKGLLLFSTSAEAQRWSARIINQALLLLVSRFRLLSLAARPLASALIGATSRRRQPELHRELIEGIKRLEPDGLAHVIRTVLVERLAMSEELWRVECPTLVVAGAEDAAISPLQCDRIARRITGALFQMVAQAGHLAPLESPEPVNALCRRFLAEKGL